MSDQFVNSSTASKFWLSATLKSCARSGSLTEGRSVHDQVIRSGQDANVVVSTSIVDMYAKCGSFKEAYKTFDNCQNRDLVSWNAFISACIDHEHSLLALDCFQKMQQNAGFCPNKASFILALKACGAENMLKQGRLVHEHVIRRGLVADEWCGSSLIDMYAKCGDFNDASVTFETLPLKNVVCWGALMAGHAQHGQGAAVLERFEEMQKKGVHPTPAIFSCVLKACGLTKDLSTGKRLHESLLNHGLCSDQMISNALMDMYAKCGDFGEAHKVLNGSGNHNEWSWGAIIGGYMKQGNSLSALKLFEEMQKSSVKPNSVIYSCILKACGDVGCTFEGRLLHQRTVANSMEGDEAVSSSLINMYASFGSLEEARKIFNTCSKANPACFDVMIIAYTKHGHNALALELFEKAQRSGLKPGEAVMSCAIKACGGLKALVYGRFVHGYIVVNLAIPDIVIVNGLIDMYLTCGSLKEAEIVFEKSAKQDVVSWNSIIGGYIQLGYPTSAFKFFNRMIKSDLKPDRVTFLCMVKVCSSLGALQDGRFMYGKIVESGFEADTAVKISIVDMFARCGSFQEAEKLVAGVAKEDTGAWSALIAGYAQQGDFKMARERFHDMQNYGLMPDITAFTVILSGCCHSGDVEEGYRLFSSMKREYGVQPKLEHFNCMIDLLSRAGRLRDASQIFETMPDFPDLMGWMSLLNACKRYGSAEVGKKCAGEILQLDPENSAVFTLMSNTYADGHMWDEAAGLEKLRSFANAWKKPAMAWIQIDDQMHEFLVRDEVQDDVCMSRLKFLKLQMEKAGYVPKLDVVIEGKARDTLSVKDNEVCERATDVEALECPGSQSSDLLVNFGDLTPLKGANSTFSRDSDLSYQRPDEVSISKINRKQVMKNLCSLDFRFNHYLDFSSFYFPVNRIIRAHSEPCSQLAA